jgi:hypothetical protein
MGEPRFVIPTEVAERGRMVERVVEGLDRRPRTNPYLPASFPFAKGQEELLSHSGVLLSSAHGGKAGIGGFSPQTSSVPAARLSDMLPLSGPEWRNLLPQQPDPQHRNRKNALNGH